MSTTRRAKPTVNMAKIMANGGLTKSEKAICTMAVRIASKRYQGADIHVGTLPFLDALEVASALDAGSRRLTSALAAKIRLMAKGEFEKAGTKTIPLYLNDQKVIKRFGPHPERGVRIPGLMPELRKRERKMFECEKDAVDTLYPVVTLALKRNYWIVKCPAQHAERVTLWLIDNCR